MARTNVNQTSATGNELTMGTTAAPAPIVAGVTVGARVYLGILIATGVTSAPRTATIIDVNQTVVGANAVVVVVGEQGDEGN